VYRNEVLENKDPKSPFKDGRIVTWKSPRPRYAYFGWKNTHPLFRDKNVRKALALACNRQEMCQRIFGGSYEPMGAPIFPGSRDADPSLTPLPFDLKEAASMLDAAGWALDAGTGLRAKVVDGENKKFEFSLIWPSPSPEFEAMLNQYKNDLLSIGIKMNPMPMQWGVFQKKIHDREFEAMTLLWVENGWEHDFDQIWQHANDKERRVIVEELIQVVSIYEDRLEVQVSGASPLLVTLDEVGVRAAGTGPVVSEGRLAP
jgi:ABC-type transport system substrate-binding protein